MVQRFSLASLPHARKVTRSSSSVVISSPTISTLKPWVLSISIATMTPCSTSIRISSDTPSKEALIHLLPTPYGIHIAGVPFTIVPFCIDHADSGNSTVNSLPLTSTLVVFNHTTSSAVMVLLLTSIRR